MKTMEERQHAAIRPRLLVGNHHAGHAVFSGPVAVTLQPSTV